jgi:hypothetical protein
VVVFFVGMESSSMPPEMDSPGEDIMLMETVKRIVTHEERNESEEAFFLISQDQAVQYPEGPNVEETVSHTHQTDVALEWIRLCRICANTSDRTIPIFEGYGAQHDLSTKILKYLPIHVCIVNAKVSVQHTFDGHVAHPLIILHRYPKATLCHYNCASIARTS